MKLYSRSNGDLVDEMCVDETGVDKIGSIRSGTIPFYACPTDCPQVSQEE